jgi:hypothetical protein
MGSGKRMLGLSHALFGVIPGTELLLVIVISKFLKLIELPVYLQVNGLPPMEKEATHWFPNSDATKRNPDFKIQRPDATGTVSKYLILSALTSSSSCSMVILYKSPSSLCSRKKKAPLR